nr:iron-containing alcohol dehydrogenase [Paracoccaceae bacterium]
MQPFTFNTTPRIHFGAGKLADLGAIVAAGIGRRVLIVTDPGLLRTGIVARAEAYLAEAGVETVRFDRVEADPPESVVLAAVASARDSGVQGVIGVGGGSSLDVAKLAALLATGHDALREIYGVDRARGPRLPLLLAPTTAGTGSEVTPISVVTTGENEKMAVVSPVLLPDIALVDPELAHGLPPNVTAATGIDAMVHAIEAHASLSPNNNPGSRALARAALALLGRALEPAVRNGADAAA